MLPVRSIAMILADHCVASTVDSTSQVPMAPIDVHVDAVGKCALQPRVCSLMAAQLLHNHNLWLWLHADGSLSHDHTLCSVLDWHDARAIHYHVGLHRERVGWHRLLHQTRLHGLLLHGHHSRLLLDELGLRRGSIRRIWHWFAVWTDHLTVCIDDWG